MRGCILTLANAGTPLMWAPVLQLAIGNAVVGAIEAAALRLLFKTVYLRALIVAVIANYFSLIAGWPLLGFLSDRFAPTIMGEPPIFGLHRYIAALIVAAFVLSFLLEWPVYVFAFPRGRRRLGRVTAAALLAQVISHLILVPFYWHASAQTATANVTLVRTPEFARTPAAQLFFVAPDQNRVMRRTIGGGEAQEVARIPLSAKFTEPRLVLLRDSKGHAELWLGSEWADELSLRLADAGPAPADLPKDWPERRGAVDLRPLDQQDGWAGADFWAYGGLRYGLGNRVDGSIAVEVPFLAWPARCPTILPGDQIVFQLGPQVLLLDMRTRRIAVIAMGAAPAVLLPTTTTQPASRPTTQLASAQ